MIYRGKKPNSDETAVSPKRLAGKRPATGMVRAHRPKTLPAAPTTTSTGAGKQQRERRTGRQAVRQICLLLAIERAKLGLTIRELQDVAADGSTERTIYRDLAQLGQAGFSLEATDGKYRLVGEPHKLVPMTPSDLVAICVAERLAAPFGGAWLGASYGDLRVRVAALLTPNGRAFAQELARTVAVNAPDAAPLADHTVMDTVRAGIELEQRVRIEYAAPNTPTRERVLEPYGTVRANDGTLYLVARCAETVDFKKFHLGRIRRAQLSDETFDRDPSFDIERYQESAFDMHHGPVAHVSLTVAAPAVHLFKEHRYHPSQRVTQREDGSALVEIEAGGVEAIARFIARFGGDVRVRAPEELRVAVVGLHVAGLAANREEDATLTPDDRARR